MLSVISFNTLFIFNWRAIYNIVLVLPYINRSQPQIYICPLPLEPLSHLPPYPTPLTCHRALDLSSVHHTENSHYLHMVMYMYQCCPSICPTLSFLQCVCYLCLHLLCCSADGFISTIFLDSIYMC